MKLRTVGSHLPTPQRPHGNWPLVFSRCLTTHDGILAGFVCLSLPTIASVQFEYWSEKGFLIFGLPMVGSFLALCLLYLVVELALSHEDYFTIIFMGLIFPAGLLPFLGIIAFQEHSFNMFARFMVALLLTSLYMLSIGMALEAYHEYGLLNIRTIGWLVVVISGSCIAKLLSQSVGVEEILNARLQSSVYFLKSIIK